jgi:fibronectin type 3 domain-containing protein
MIVWRRRGGRGMRRQKQGRGLWRFLPLVAMGMTLTGCALLDLLPELPPATAPTGVTASVGQFADRVRVTWDAVERATTYRVFRAEASDGVYERVGEVASPSFDDVVGAENQGRWYWYKVEACNAAGCSARSAPAAGYAGYPPPPTRVQATDDLPTKITITWDPVPGATHYQVFRDRVRDGTYGVHVGTTSETRIDDERALPGLTYWYRVQVCNALGCSLTIASPADSGCRAPCPPGTSLDTEG